MISRSEVGAWVIKGDPATWNYFAYVADDRRKPNSDGLFDEHWTISNNYRKDLMEIGDLMVLWITGPRNPGIYEVGRLTSEAYPSQGFDRKYAVDLVKARQSNHVVDYACARLDDPLARAALKGDPALSTCEQIRAPQGANPSYLTVPELAALKALLTGRVDRRSLQALGWR